MSSLQREFHELNQIVKEVICCFVFYVCLCFAVYTAPPTRHIRLPSGWAGLVSALGRCAGPRGSLVRLQDARNWTPSCFSEQRTEAVLRDGRRRIIIFVTCLLNFRINPLNSELNPICYLLALLAHHFLHVSRIRVKLLTFRRLMSYIYMEHPFLMFLDHTQRRSTVGRTPLDE